MKQVKDATLLEAKTFIGNPTDRIPPARDSLIENEVKFQDTCNPKQLLGLKRKRDAMDLDNSWPKLPTHKKRCLSNAENLKENKENLGHVDFEKVKSDHNKYRKKIKSGREKLVQDEVGKTSLVVTNHDLKSTNVKAVKPFKIDQVNFLSLLCLRRISRSSTPLCIMRRSNTPNLLLGRRSSPLLRLRR